MPAKLVGRSLFFVCSLLFAALKLNYPFCPVTSTPVLNLKFQPPTCQHQEMCQGQIGAADRDTLWHCLSHTTSPCSLLAARANEGWQSSTWWPGGRYNWDNATERLREAKLHPSMFCAAGTGKLHRTCDFTTLINVQWMFIHHSLSLERQQLSSQSSL